MKYEYVEKNRIGDHIWWISSVAKFQAHYPQWQYKYGIDETLREIYQMQKEILKNEL